MTFSVFADIAQSGPRLPFLINVFQNILNLEHALTLKFHPGMFFDVRESKNGIRKALKSTLLKIYTIFNFFHPEAKIAEKMMWLT